MVIKNFILLNTLIHVIVVDKYRLVIYIYYLWNINLDYLKNYNLYKIAVRYNN